MARSRRAERVDHTQAGSQLFLGAVVARSGGVEESMAAEFSLLVASVNQLLTKYHDGELGGLELAELLAEQKVTDVGGGEWTIGATSGAWYRRMPSMDWAQVPPPGPTVRAKVQLVVSEEGTVRDTKAPGDAFAELYGEPTAGGDAAWMGDASPDSGWFAGTPSQVGLSEVDDFSDDVVTPLTPSGHIEAVSFDAFHLPETPATPDTIPDGDGDGYVPPVFDGTVHVEEPVPPDPVVPDDVDALLALWLDNKPGENPSGSPA